MNVWTKKSYCIATACLLCACLLVGCTSGVPENAESTNLLETDEPTVTAESDETEAEIQTEWETDSTETESEADESLSETTVDTEVDSLETDGEATTTEGFAESADTLTDQTEESESTAQETTSAPEAPELVLGEYTVDEVVSYFHEVVHSSEYSFGSGRADAVHKWEQPIYYQLLGDYTVEDMRTIGNMCSRLNEVDGFPGIYASPDEQTTNVQIYFYDQETMLREFGHYINYEAADGMMTYWYSNSTNAIQKATVCCRSDISQVLRDSVAVEELFNMLGMPNDTKTRTDSILYQYGSSVLEPSELDWLIVRLLYNEKMLCGYDCEQSNDVIRALCAQWIRE